MQTQAKAPQRLWSMAGCLGGGLLLFGLWLRNYNLIGCLYDYSIITSAAGQLQAGQLPYRDFITPLQSLTIYASYAAERLFGQRYLSLAYGNLLLALGFYAAILWNLRPSLPFWPRLLIALALCSATVLQHGILWYNSIGIVLLTLIVWRASQWYRQGTQSNGQVAGLCGLLFLSSMTKLNFHFLGLGITLGLLSLLFIKASSEERKRLFWAVLAIVFFSLAAGPAVEILVNRTTVHDFINNVLIAAHGRIGRLLRFMSPKLYLGKVADAFPDNWCSGVFLVAGLVYGGCAWFCLRRPPDATAKEWTTSDRQTKLFLPVVLLGFYAASIALCVSEDDTQMLTSALLLVGLVAALVMFGQNMSDTQSAVFRFGVFLLAGFFAVAGSASAFMHSRLRTGEPSWADTMVRTLAKQKNLAAFWEPVPTHSALEVNPRLDGYLHGVRFTDVEFKNLQRLFAIMNEHHLHEQPQHIFWGPGLEIMNRVYHHAPPAGLPLWYDSGTSSRNEDSPRLIAFLKANDCEWIFTGGFIYTLPSDARAYIKQNYDTYQSTEDDIGLVCFHKKKPDDGIASPKTPGNQ